MPGLFRRRPAPRPTWRASVAVLAAGAIAATGVYLHTVGSFAPHSSDTIRTVANDASTASYNGIVNNAGNPLAVHGYPSGAVINPNGPALTTSLPTVGQFPDGTEVHITCYLTAHTPVSGPEAAGPGGTDPYWDQIDAANAGMPGQLPLGDVVVVPDAFVHTNAPVNQTAPPCEGPTKTTTGGGHDPRLDQGTTGNKNIATLAATQLTDGDPVQHSTDIPATCSVGDIPLDALTCGGPVKYLGLVVKYANEATIDPRLMMNILRNEDGCHFPGMPHTAWCEELRSHLPTSLGIANMRQNAFTQAQQQSEGLLAGRTWQDLAHDPALDVEAEAWYLKALETQMPATWPTAYARDELLAMAYNAGVDNITPIINGSQSPGTNAQNYLNGIRSNWDRTDQIICRSGALTCSL
ncbi:hypothetical protein [Streptomyces sp. NPDC004533]|uniref:hypothetical protein n=1 Tax=unclassified Streptomyces TaxID=2593676 RepID=UPI00339E9AF1